MIVLLFLFLSANCRAVFEILIDKYQKSIFFKLNYQWWCPEYSWKNKYVNYDIDVIIENIKARRKKFKIFGLATPFNYPVQLTDARHFFKMFEIVFSCMALIALYIELKWLPQFNVIERIASFGVRPFIAIIWGLLIYGTIWNCGFSLFYTKLLLRATYNLSARSKYIFGKMLNTIISLKVTIVSIVLLLILIPMPFEFLEWPKIILSCALVFQFSVKVICGIYNSIQRFKTRI